MRRGGFTILELMVVMGIIAILSTIVTVVSTGVIKSTRERRRELMRDVIEQGIATYYARTGKWPDAIESAMRSGDSRWFTGDQADAIVRQVVKASLGSKGAPCLDPNALFVAPSGEAGGNGTGLNFSEAIKKNPPRHYRHLNTSQMAFGYQDPSSGKYRRYKVHFNAATEHVTVGW